MTTVLNETQSSLRDLAAELFTRQVDAARVEKVEATPDRFDRELWDSLAASGLLGVVVPEVHGGLGLGAVELALVLEQFGRVVAPIPLVSTVLASWAIAEHGTDEQRERWLPGLLDGTAVAAVAPPQSMMSTRTPDGGTSATVIGVPWAHVADLVVVTAGDDLFLVEPTGSGVTATREETTSREIALTLSASDDAPVDGLGEHGSSTWLQARMRVALAAVQAGVTDAALRLTASYTSEREQFGKPLSTFQAVALKAADAYVDATVIRATTMQAAWALDNVADPALEVLTAAWWAAEGGQRCVHLTQHLHGGMGADVTYPVHRYFLWGKQIELLLGGASALLAELGDVLAEHPDAGDAVVL